METSTIETVQPSVVGSSIEQGYGRGGDTHTTLQQSIGRFAETRGYRVYIEKEILEGSGIVDVVLEKGDLTIAVEISITSKAGQELAHVLRCLKAGFKHVAVVSPDPRALAQLSKSIMRSIDRKRGRVKFFSPEQLLHFIDKMEFGHKGLKRSELHEDLECLIDAKELERLLSIDVKTIYSYVQRGIIPYVRIQSNLRFSKPDILEWIAEQSFKPQKHK